MAETETSTTTVSVSNRKILIDAGGALWDFANPNLIAVLPVRGDPNSCAVIFAGSGSQGISIPFAAASAAFAGS